MRGKLAGSATGDNICCDKCEDDGLGVAGFATGDNICCDKCEGDGFGDLERSPAAVGNNTWGVINNGGSMGRATANGGQWGCRVATNFGGEVRVISRFTSA